MNDAKSLNQLKQELRKEIVAEVLDIVRDEIEENFSDDFIRAVEEAEVRVKEGDVIEYTLEPEMRLGMGRTNSKGGEKWEI